MVITREEEKEKDKEKKDNEFKILYNLLTDLVKKNNTLNDTKSSFNNEVIHNTNKTGKPATTEPQTENTTKQNVWQCQYCDKYFSNELFLKLHINDVKACKKSESLPDFVKKFKPEKDIRYYLDSVLDKATTDTDTLTCKFCEHRFSHKGNINKHYIINAACNRLAYYEMKKIIDTLPL